jgi:hypothetical protein
VTLAPARHDTVNVPNGPGDSQATFRDALVART